MKRENNGKFHIGPASSAEADSSGILKLGVMEPSH
mgnify:CR=1 FL=1